MIDPQLIKTDLEIIETNLKKRDLKIDLENLKKIYKNPVFGTFLEGSGGCYIQIWHRGIDPDEKKFKKSIFF